MDIKELQAFINELQAKFREDFELSEEVREFATLTKITEELGEVSNELLKKHKLQRKEKMQHNHELGKEIADLVITIGSFCHVAKINLDEELTKRITQIRERHNLCQQ